MGSFPERNRTQIWTLGPESILVGVRVGGVRALHARGVTGDPHGLCLTLRCNGVSVIHMTTTTAYIGTCRYGHTTRMDVADIRAKFVVECRSCLADPTITAVREAFLAEHPRGIFNLIVLVSALRGRVSVSHECNGECTHATGDKCVCSCGGRNHGIDWVA